MINGLFLKNILNDCEFIGNWDNIQIDFFSQDSKLCSKNMLFINFNNHNHYIQEAINNGAIALMGKQIYQHPMPQIICNNLIKTLTIIKDYIFKLSKKIIVAITGSVGKTTMRYKFFYKYHDKVVTNFRNYNTHIGLLMSIVQLIGNKNIGFFECGLNKAGDGPKQGQFIAPHILIITNVLTSHEKNFISYEQLVMNKLSMALINKTKVILCPLSIKKYTHFMIKNTLFFHNNDFIEDYWGNNMGFSFNIDNLWYFINFLL